MLGKYTILKKKKRPILSWHYIQNISIKLERKFKGNNETMKYKYFKNGRIEFSKNKIIIIHVKIMMMDLPTT